MSVDQHVDGAPALTPPSQAGACSVPASDAGRLSPLTPCTLADAAPDAHARVDTGQQAVPEHLRLGLRHLAAAQALLELAPGGFECSNGRPFAKARRAFLDGHKAAVIGDLLRAAAAGGAPSAAPHASAYEDLHAKDMDELGCRLEARGPACPLYRGLCAIDALSAHLKAAADYMYASVRIGRDSDQPRWIRDKVQFYLDSVYFAPSPRHGLGAFAARALTKGEVLLQLRCDDVPARPSLLSRGEQVWQALQVVQAIEALKGPLNDPCGPPDLRVLKSVSFSDAVEHLQSCVARSAAHAALLFEFPPDADGNVYTAAPYCVPHWDCVVLKRCIRISALKDVAANEELTRCYSAEEWVLDALRAVHRAGARPDFDRAVRKLCALALHLSAVAQAVGKDDCQRTLSHQLSMFSMFFSVEDLMHSMQRA